MNLKANRTNLIRRFARPTALALVAGSMIALASCGKKEEPVVEAPPPPPPPPPAAVNVSFDTISQDMKADSRVQFAADLAVTDENIAKSVVKLADAVAKGDAGQLRSLVNQGTKKVISDLENNGLWTQQMNGIEAVRVVYAAPYDAEANKITMDALLKKIIAVRNTNDLPAGVTADMRFTIGRLVGAAMTTGEGAPKTDEDVKKFLDGVESGETIDKFLGDSQYDDSRKLIEAMLQDALNASPYPNGKFLVILAVQDKDGATLSGWGAEEAFGGLEFNIGNTVQTVKPNAASFDGVGLNGFFTSQRHLNKLASEDSGKPPAEKAEEKKADGTGEKTKDPENDPSKKRTPAGPVQIPGGG
jgi:hypothetical protein